MEEHRFMLKNAQLCLILLTFISRVWCDIYSSDPCGIELLDKKVEFLDKTADYRASNCQQMSEGIGVAWTIEENIIKFEVHAVTEGWVAIGINKGPIMLGADVAVGWVNSRGDGFLYDGKNDVRVREAPKKDTIQDTQLLEYREKDGCTSFLFSRPLVSEDKENDQDIKGRIWIIWAFASEDPDEDDWEDLAYHVRDGATSIRFFPEEEEVKEIESHTEL